MSFVSFSISFLQYLFFGCPVLHFCINFGLILEFMPLCCSIVCVFGVLCSIGMLFLITSGVEKAPDELIIEETIVEFELLIFVAVGFGSIGRSPNLYLSILVSSIFLAVQLCLLQIRYVITGASCCMLSMLLLTDAFGFGDRVSTLERL